MTAVLWKTVSVLVAVFGMSGVVGATPIDDYLAILDGGQGADRGHEKDVEVFLDQFANPVERQEALALIYDEWKARANKREDILSLERVLCRIAPYQLPSSQTMDLQKDMRARFGTYWSAYQNKPTEEAFRAAKFADCAAFNVKDGYFDLVRNAKSVMPYGNCGEAKYESATKLRGILKALRGLNEDYSLSEGSYYAIRSEQFTAALAVATALAEFREESANFPNLKRDIQDAGRRLRSLSFSNQKAASSTERGSVADLLSMFANNRNGWRLANEVAYHAALFGLVGADLSDDSSVERNDDSSVERNLDWLKEIRDAKPVLKYKVLEDKVEPWILDEIREEDRDYRDPIRIDRIFPGLMKKPKEDCQRNRRQSLKPSDLANGTLECWKTIGSRLDDIDDFHTFDACLNKIESKVWWLQLGAFRQKSSVDRAMQRINEEFKEFSDIEFTLKEPDSSSSYYRIRTQTPLTRTEAGVMAKHADTIGFSRLIGRDAIR